MAQGWLQLAVFVAIVIALTRPLGAYMAGVFRNERVFLSPVIAPVERLTYRILRVDPNDDQNWKVYARDLIAFSLFSNATRSRRPGSFPGTQSTTFPTIADAFTPPVTKSVTTDTSTSRPRSSRGRKRTRF